MRVAAVKKLPSIAENPSPVDILKMRSLLAGRAANWGNKAAISIQVEMSKEEVVMVDGEGGD